MKSTIVFLALTLLTGISAMQATAQSEIFSDSVNAYGDSTKVLKATAEQEVTAFTPNGDGINDVFLKDEEIKVFNRWGKEVYHGKNGWNGTKNGKELAAGTYYYIRYDRNQNGDLINTHKGAVTLIRR